MGDFDIANQRTAQVSRTLKLLNFKFMQLRHTSDQLLAALQDLDAALGGEAPPGQQPQLEALVA